MNYNHTPLRFIAEIGSNHNQEISRIYSLIMRAKSIGCWAVKFQYYKADKLYAPGNIPQDLEKTELSISFIKKIRNICHDNNIVFGCSVFHEEGVYEIAPYVDYLKIASYELLKTSLIEKVADTGLPLHISTGLANTEEIINAMSYTKDARVILYHCCSEYPAAVNRVDLRRLKALQSLFPNNQWVEHGYSDHSVNIPTMCAAAALGATYIEFHFDIDGAGDEYYHRHCWLPSEAAEMIIKTTQAKEAVMGLGTCLSKASTDRLKRADPEDGMRPHKEIRNV